MGISAVITLLSGVALFLFGMLLMGEGLKSVAGSKLEIILYKLSSTPLKGVLLGTGVTSIIQSSSATSIMVVGFVNSGMMKAKQAIGVVLGAILGTSITGWIICLSNVSGDGNILVQLLSTATLTGIIAVVGIYLRMFCKSFFKRYVGDILMGFAILMTGMSTISSSVSSLKDDPNFIGLITSFRNPLIGILVGMLITCVLQSASATVGILQALSVTGAISFEVAFPIIMGIAIGAAVPVLLSALGASVNGKRVAMAYLVIDVIGVIIWAIVFYTVNAFMAFPFMSMTMDMVSIALVNSLFRFATVVVLAPFIKYLEKLVSLIFKTNPEEEEETAEIDRLEERFIDHPAIALEQSTNAVISMARKAKKTLSRSIDLIYDYSEKEYKYIQKKEAVIDKYEDKLGTYLVKLTGKELTDEQSGQISKILHSIGDFERIGDHAVNIADNAREISEKKIVLSQTAQNELKLITSAVNEIVGLATDALNSNDVETAKRVEPLEQVIDKLCDKLKDNHIHRLQKGECTLEHGFVFSDILTNYKRIADHCSNVAVAIIELDRNLFDTHKYLSKVKKDSNTDFQSQYEMFSQKYMVKK